MKNYLMEEKLETVWKVILKISKCNLQGIVFYYYKSIIESELTIINLE